MVLPVAARAHTMTSPPAQTPASGFGSSPSVVSPIRPQPVVGNATILQPQNMNTSPMMREDGPVMAVRPQAFFHAEPQRFAPIIFVEFIVILLPYLIARDYFFLIIIGLS
jgi:hypothetical protein